MLPIYAYAYIYNDNERLRFTTLYFENLPITKKIWQQVSVIRIDYYITITTFLLVERAFHQLNLDVELMNPC